MKYLFTILFTACIALSFSSCSKEEEKVVVNNSRPELSSSASGMIALEQTNAAQVAVTFNYNDVDFGFKDALGYILQLAPAGQNFRADSVVEVSVDRKAAAVSLTVLDLNKLLINLFQPAGRTIDLEARIKTTEGNLFSNTIPLTVQTYEDWPRILPYTAPDQFLYIPGAYQPSPSWSPDNPAIAKVFSVNSDKKYSGTIVLSNAADGFKLTPAPNWTNSYGMTSVAMTGKDAAGALQYNGGGDFKFTGSGTFTLDVDLNTNTWKATQTNWSIIGDAAIDWNTDVDFDFDPVTQTFYKELPMKPGGFKFRKNHDWGGDFPGANLQITTAGNYKVLLDLRVPTDPVWKVLKQ